MALLLKPLQIKSLSLANRLVMPPMATAKADPDGKVSQALLDYYDDKTRGGYISLVIIEHSYVSLEGKAHKNQLSVADDGMIAGLKELAGVIHRNGSKTVMQINHAGCQADEEITGMPAEGPSAVINPRAGNIPHALTQTEVDQIVRAFRDAAERVKKAGFDGVEIHAAHGYLLNQFFSPLTNKREDEYGGSLINRIRIHLEVIKAVRAAVGDKFPILVRLGAADYIDGGITIVDSQIAAREFEKAGVDILDISGGFCGYIVPGLSGQGYFAPLSRAVKKVVSLPVILTGGITEAQAAEQLLTEGKADLIGVGRAILKDSQWPQKALESLSEH
ncbi:MAG: NADH:flavin oxidoreductase [Firmicutes bacterium]|nr:NADH:flavin oxidoreductase [Bacillota bacterium]